MLWWLIAFGILAVLLLIKPTRHFFLSTFSRARAFLKEVVDELKKVSWPSRSELKSSTGLVIFSMVMLAVFVGLVDVLLNAVIGFLVR